MGQGIIDKKAIKDCDPVNIPDPDQMLITSPKQANLQ